MFGTPRCREWTPLATQQLRLRSLLQIVGYNIRPPEWCMSPCSFYLTLHHTTMSAPFYTSERISSPHPKWKEIDPEITQRMSSTNVVIRIWCHILYPYKDVDDQYERPQDAVIQTWGIYFSGLRYIGANLALNFTSDSFKLNTLVFQMNGGYFCSYKSLKLDVIPAENELEHGSLSSDSSGRTNLSRITLESKFIQAHKLNKESRSISPSNASKRNEKEYSKSHSPVERGFKQNYPRIKTSASLNIGKSQREVVRHREENSENKYVDKNHIFEHAPENLDVKEFTSSDIDCDSLKNASTEELSASKIDLSETAENYDLRNESDGMPKYRYLALNFLKSEIRPSYNAAKLQKLHLLQYSIKKKQEAVQEIKERIFKKSALCTDTFMQPNAAPARLKSRSQRNLFSPEEDQNLSNHKTLPTETDISVKNGKINGPRLTLKLNDLLSFKSKPSPFQRAEHLRLTKQIEILRFKRIILADERDSKLANIRRLKERHAKLLEENQDVGSELMENYHNLSRRNEDLKENRKSCAALLELAARSHAALANRRSELLTQLHQIFYIEQKDETTWTICNVPLPICGDDSPRTLNPVTDSVAAGFVAQATCLSAALLNQPLRYSITLLGSASKILDITPDLPDPNIPLFARGGDATLFRYAMFLLNKCIAQLLWGRSLPVTDMRPTLANLQRLMSKPTNLTDSSKMFGTYKWLTDNRCPRTQSLRSMVASERGKYRQFNRFKDENNVVEIEMDQVLTTSEENNPRESHSEDAVDGQSPQTVMNLRKHRHSRSVGSYHDDQELAVFDTSTTSIMGSEPNIYNTKLTQANSSELPISTLKTHNSDSEISRLAVEQQINESNSEHRVIFTLGDDTYLTDFTTTEKLVRISTNNGDECCSTCLDDNVKRICSEIESFCSNNVKSDVGINEGFDVARNNIDIVEYMEKRKTSTDIEDEVSCMTCEHNKDGVCDIDCAKNVKDVIVIRSAEAILDTGQDIDEEQREQNQ